jgi:hypothetical protein
MRRASIMWGLSALVALAPVACLVTLMVSSQAAGQGLEQGLAKSISIVKVAQVRLSGLRDFIFQGAGEAPAPQEAVVCVHSTDAGRYVITATSHHGGSGSFSLRAGQAGPIDYEVTWYDRAIGGQALALRSGLASPSLSGADRDDPTCKGTGTARLRIALNEGDFMQAAPALYADTLILTVAPP